MSRENSSIARAKFRNRTLLQAMETIYLDRNKVFKENTRIFGPPMVKFAVLWVTSRSLSKMRRPLDSILTAIDFVTSRRRSPEL